MKIGAVTYLNTRPLIHDLAQQTVGSCNDVAWGSKNIPARIFFDYPSRLAEELAKGNLDVALISSIEYFRRPGYVIVSDACIACDGPVRSVKLYGHVPVEKIRTLALDEGSRTSAALARILLKERFHIEPEIYSLPIDSVLESTMADAIMLIGDRGLLPPLPGQFEFIWDLGEEWVRWTTLPFVFALWVARPEVDLQNLDILLQSSRDAGLKQLKEIAQQYASSASISAEECLVYFRDNLRFQLGPRQQQGLKLFYDLAQQNGLVPAGVDLVFYHRAHS